MIKKRPKTSIIKRILAETAKMSLFYPPETPKCHDFQGPPRNPRKSSETGFAYLTLPPHPCLKEITRLNIASPGPNVSRWGKCQKREGGSRDGGGSVSGVSGGSREGRKVTFCHFPTEMSLSGGTPRYPSRKPVSRALLVVFYTNSR